MRKVSKWDGPYLIQFKDADILPELLSNRKLRETIDVIHADSNGKNYRVYSKINDKKLQQLIVKELGLTTNQVQVTYTKLYTFVWKKHTFKKQTFFG